MESSKEIMDRAEYLFFTYNGNHYYMANDGVYEEYKSYNIPKEQESIWLTEINSSAIRNLSDSSDIKIDFTKACSSVRKTKNVSDIDCLFDFLFSEQVSNQPENVRRYVYETFLEMLIYLDDTVSAEKYKNTLNSLFNELKNSSADAENIRRIEYILNNSFKELG